MPHETLSKSKNTLKNRNKLLAIAVSAVGMLAITGCAVGGESAAAARKGMTVQERIGFDYANWETPDGESFYGQDCLGSNQTPYDPNSAVITSHIDAQGHEVAVIIPKGYKDTNVNLSLAGFNKLTQDLQPADSQSATILRIYGCDPSKQPHQ